MNADRPLTARLKQIVELAADGKTDKEISHVTGLAEGTLRTYWDRLRQRYDARSRTAVIAKALISPDAAFQKRLLFHLPLFIWTADPSGYVTFCNGWFLTWGGLNPDESLGLGCRALMPDDELAENEAKWCDAQRSREAYDSLVHLRCGPDREMRLHKICLIPIFSAQGELEKWVGYGREIAENADQQMIRFLTSMMA